MYQVEVYLRVRKAVMVEGMSIREASRVFGLHRDAVRKMTAYSILTWSSSLRSARAWRKSSLRLGTVSESTSTERSTAGFSAR